MASHCRKLKIKCWVKGFIRLSYSPFEVTRSLFIVKKLFIKHCKSYFNHDWAFIARLKVKMSPQHTHVTQR